MVETVNGLLSSLTILGQLIVLLLLVYLLFFRDNSTLTEFFSDNALKLSFIVAFIAMAGSLFYSEVAGYEPCKLCWFQRILMYPQVIILGLALLRKEKIINYYALTLSGVGAIVAAAHYYLQITGISVLPCSAVGYSSACSQVFTMAHGYITIPLMSFTAFLMIAGFSLAGISVSRERSWFLRIKNIFK